jgi:hypothetical protein
MLKKNFTAPALFMLLLAIAYLAVTGYFLVNGTGALFDQNIQVFLLAITLIWPVLMLLESYLYWRIRKRNLLRRSSWAHCSLFAFAYVTFFIKGWILELYDNFTPNIDITKFVHVVTLTQLLLYWVSVIGAHIFFIRALVKARAQKHAQPTADPLNLLDDVLTGD